jgi:hypothetical protein
MKPVKKGHAFLLVMLMLTLACVFTALSCKTGSSQEEGWPSAEEVIQKCSQKLKDMNSVYVNSEAWYRNSGVEEMREASESYIEFPEVEHKVWKVEEPIYFDDILEEWRFGEERYLRYGDDRIALSTMDEMIVFPELSTLEHIVDPEIISEEQVDGYQCYKVEGKLPYDFEDIANGYLMATYYIDNEDFLLRKFVIEIQPIRYIGESYDDSYVRWAESIYSRYNEDFNITPPAVSD